MGRNKEGAPRFYRSTKTREHYVQKAVELLQSYPEVVASYHVAQTETGIRKLVFGLRLPSGEVAPVQIEPEIVGTQARLDALERSDTASAEVVAWAQLHALLEMQLEAVASGAARPSEVFGGAVLTSADRTIGNALEEGAADVLEGEVPLLQAG